VSQTSILLRLVCVNLQNRQNKGAKTMESNFVDQSVHTDVVVIGGGMAGLSAACYLARAGKAVTLFEKASNLGGRAATQKYDEYCFNRGGHAFYTGRAASEVLQELGVTYSYAIPKKVFGLQQNKLYPFPVNLPTLLRTNLLSASDKQELTRLFITLPRIKTREIARVSVQEWLERTIEHPQVRRLMAAFAQTNTYSAALDQVSAEIFVARLQQSLKHPVHYINGGWQTLVDTLRHAAEQAGVRIVSGMRVEAVAHRDGQVQGVHLRDGSFVQASAVIIAATPQDVTKLVDDGNNPALRRIVDTIIPVQIACLDVALNSLPRSCYPVVQHLERPMFLSTQSLYARIAPQGGALIHTFKQLDPAHPTDPHEDERELEGMLDIVQPGWRDALVKRIFLPRIEAVGALPTVSSGGFAGRPGVSASGIANLYLAGDWIGDEGYLVDASMASARQAARLVLQNSGHSREEKVPEVIIQKA
jgi:phytoene dehydrogenase-like protein